MAEGKRLGIEVNIYDENSYPAGFAGGHVPSRAPDTASQYVQAELDLQPQAVSQRRGTTVAFFAVKRDAGGLWKAALKLEPGLYEYKFVINGERWEEDPLNLHRVHNEHGTFNSLRKVGPFSANDRKTEKDTAKGQDEPGGAN